MITCGINDRVESLLLLARDGLKIASYKLWSEGMEGFGVGFMIVLWLLLIVLAVLWICMPFALFGTKPLLRQLIAEQQKTNKLLKDQLSAERRP